VRLSDLLHRRVVDGAACEVGKVLDVRLVRDGPVLGTFGAAFRVQGLIVGPALAGTRLGYGRTGMTGPFLLEVPLRILHRRVRFVPWERVVEVGEETIRISGSAADLHEPAAT
jgi:sporulation protein YlmC with PRC-barrel domain